MKLFVVLGMHRSGTSVVSRALQLLGAALGPEADLMPPKPDNPTGFWESLTVAQLHDDLVAHLGGTWGRPPVLEEGWEYRGSLSPFLDRIHAVVESHFAAAKVAAWKDPRGSLFLPLWRRVVPITGTVLCIRHPAEVARSLEARDGLGAEHVAALWLRYVVAAWLEDAAHLLVTFDEAVEQPVRIVERLAEFVGEPPPDAGIAQAVRRFVNGDLRHHRAVAADAGPVLSLAQAVYALVTTQPAAVVRPVLRSLADAWRLEGRLDAGHAKTARGSIAVPSVVTLLRYPA